MSDNKRNGSFAGKGYYIALILCAAAIGITSYVYYRNAESAQTISIQETFPDVQADAPVPEAAGEVPVIATQPQTPSYEPVPSSAPAIEPSGPRPTEKQALKTASPIAGETIFGYSMEALSYNQTTRDWRVHNGVDIAAEAGAEVLAAADGEVYTVYEDDAMGHTVVIRHADGYITRYSSLTQDIPVQAGQKVSLGDVIGHAGDTALVETSLGCHVHFAVTHYDEPLDPAEFLALGG